MLPKRTDAKIGGKVGSECRPTADGPSRFFWQYVSKIVMQYLAAQKRYNFIITDYLYKKSLNNNRGLLPFIVDSTLEQEVKEALIGYYFLWTK